MVQNVLQQTEALSAEWAKSALCRLTQRYTDACLRIVIREGLA